MTTAWTFESASFNIGSILEHATANRSWVVVTVGGDDVLEFIDKERRLMLNTVNGIRRGNGLSEVTMAEVVACEHPEDGMCGETVVADLARLAIGETDEAHR